MRPNFHCGLWKIIFDRLSWNTSLNWMGLIYSWCRSKILSYEVKLIFFSVFGRIFIIHTWVLVIQPMFNKFESLTTSESHHDWESSTWIIQIHIQAFRKISSLVCFRLSSCNSSPPLRLVVGGSLKVYKMSYTYENSILSVAMSYMRQEEDMEKNPFWDFWAGRLWPFNFQTEIFKFKYLGFCSSDRKSEDSSRNIKIERRHGEKPLLIFWVFHLRKSLWLFNFP